MRRYTSSSVVYNISRLRMIYSTHYQTDFNYIYSTLVLLLSAVILLLYKLWYKLIIELFAYSVHIAT